MVLGFNNMNLFSLNILLLASVYQSILLFPISEINIIIHCKIETYLKKSALFVGVRKKKQTKYFEEKKKKV